MKRAILVVFMMTLMAGCGSGGGGGGAGGQAKVTALDGNWSDTGATSTLYQPDNTLLVTLQLQNGVFRSTEPTPSSVPIATAVAQGFINRSRDGLFNVNGQTLTVTNVIGNKGSQNEYSGSDVSYTYRLSGNTLVFNTPAGNRIFTRMQ